MIFLYDQMQSWEKKGRKGMMWDDHDGWKQIEKLYSAIIGTITWPDWNYNQK